MIVAGVIVQLSALMLIVLLSLLLPKNNFMYLFGFVVLYFVGPHIGGMAVGKLRGIDQGAVRGVESVGAAVRYVRQPDYSEVNLALDPGCASVWVLSADFDYLLLVQRLSGLVWPGFSLWPCHCGHVAF